MIVAAARAVGNNDVCFVGIGVPSAACNLARLTHAPDVTLIYESGTIAAKPQVFPLSIGDGELSETALTTVPVPEMFQYWLQGGHISIGFLGAAQLDRYGNINTTVIGDYDRPEVRLPGAGGAPEIATSCDRIFITLKHSRRALVPQLDFTTSLGFGPSGLERARLGVSKTGPALVVTDLCIMRPEEATNELVVDSLHPGVTDKEITEATGWPMRFSDDSGTTPPPTSDELSVLRELQRRTDEAQRDPL